MIISFGSRQLTLLPERALLVDSTLILADTHFGKSASFRARGIPVPEGETRADTARILDLLARHRPARLVIAGDLLHAAESKAPEVLSSLGKFFGELACEAHLVLGNHDLRAGRLPPAWSVKCCEALEMDDLVIVHDPAHAPSDRFTISGHLHPVARIRDGANTSLRSPCFWLSGQQLVIPSFGTFTGGSVVRPAPGDRVFAPLADRVVEIPAGAL